MLTRKNIPNQLTILRLIFAVAMFAVLSFYQYAGYHKPNTDPQTELLIAALVLFVVAAITDALDGYFARRWQVISLFGRIMDPVADKILVIGAFIFLAGPGFADPDGGMISGVYPWMAVVILLRELLVTSIRAALESQGIDFSAKSAGKWKMILQAVVIPVVLLIVIIDPHRYPILVWVRDLLVIATVLVTIISGLPYLTGAQKTLRAM